MSDFSLQATSRTPEVHLNTAGMTLAISGESYPEDFRQFYTTINEQLAVYFTTKPDRPSWKKVKTNPYEKYENGVSISEQGSATQPFCAAVPVSPARQSGDGRSE